MVHASDLNFYYCKYHGHVGAAHKLFKEYLIASFLECWEFRRVPIGLIQVLPEHIPQNLGIVRKSFDVPSFGLQEIQGVADLSKINEDVLVNARPKRELKNDLLKLAFFDIWTCNEDRSSGNYNILYKHVDGEYVIYPIDHEACFNHGNFERGLTPITYEDNLIYSTLFYKLFHKGELKNKDNLEGLKERFYLYSRNCGKKVGKILQEIPQSWDINIVKKEGELKQFLLNDDWFEICWNSFIEFLNFLQPK
ncbi:MAG: hypothetical protein P0Y53_00790 [Candidatus Pseudobacter hemicellulosilyticus]|uniref:HipA-like kinase domain-containing protein n=1 Tax=Candidatus Pseudobacter hemicellulosilyticus TaxID=3121375 RepID=A0AAJ6BH88_9BACT|nr:MAG: hypothetical protein P0Y53_00790 [Pseudobacter sp.]